jgi:sugar fermentation stimulation protein A
MKFPALVPAVFVKRPNRFTADVRLGEGAVERVYVPTTGRLTGALRPGCRVWLERAADRERKTPYTLVLTELEEGGLCSVNASLANRIFEKSVLSGALDAFCCDRVEREVSWGSSRLDFRLWQGERPCWVEVKSVTYVAEGVGMFPDAPTERGRKHLGELVKLVVEGQSASVVFVAQRPDAECFKPFEAIDPDFANSLRLAQKQGVGVHAYRCEVSPESIEIADEIPVEISPPLAK